MTIQTWRRTILLAAGALALALLPALLPAAEDAKAIEDYNFAAWLYNGGKYAMAADAYRTFLKTHDDHEKIPDARFGLAQALFHQDQFKEAAEEYEGVRSRFAAFPQMPEVLFQLGQARIGLGQFAEAEKLFAELAAKHPDHYLADWALARRGACLVSLNRDQEAEPPLRAFLDKYAPEGKPAAKSAATAEMLARLDKAGVKAGPAFLELAERSAFYLALARFNQDQFDAARGSFQAFLAQYPDSQLKEEARFRLAQALYRQGAFADAAAAYRSAAEGKSDFADAAAFERGLALHKAGSLKDAAAAFADMAARFPASARAPKARLYSGTLLYDAGDPSGALARLKPLADAKGELADAAAYWSGMCLLKMGKPAEAEKAFAGAMEAFPKSALLADMRLGLADARLALNQNEPAAQAYREYARVSRQPDQAARALYSAAVALHRVEQYGPSDEVCGEFLGKHARAELAPQVLFLSAENRFLQKQYERAAPVYKELLDRKDTPADLAARARFRLAWVHRYAKRYAEALGELDKLDPAAAGKTVAAEAGYLRGVCLFETQKYPEAVQAFQAYLKSGEAGRFGDDALLKTAVAHTKQGQPREARDAFERLLSNYPKSELASQAQYQLGELCHELKDYGRAIGHYRKAAERQPPDELSPYALFGLAQCHYDQGDWKDAADAFGQVAATYKDSNLAAPALYRQGLSLTKLSQWAEAEGVFRALLAAAPKHELARSALFMAGTCLQEQKKWAEAAQAFQAVIDDYRADQDQPRVFYELGWSWREAGQEEKSLAAFRALADKFGGDPLAADALFHLAEAQFKTPSAPETPGDAAKRFDAARELYVKALAQSKDKRLGDKCLYRMGWCDWQNRKYKEASAAFDRLAAEFSASELVPDAIFQAGQAYARAGDPQTAAERFEALVGNPKYAGFKYLPEAIIGLGEARLALNRPGDTVKTLETWVAGNGKHPAAGQAWFLIGRARYDLKEYDAALECFGKVSGAARPEVAAQAQFYTGQALQLRQDYAGASLAYLRVQALYPEVREWVAAAMFENAKCAEALGNKEEARKILREVADQYKDTQWAALATGRLK